VVIAKRTASNDAVLDRFLFGFGLGLVHQSPPLAGQPWLIEMAQPSNLF
jgi:hypothetical protein